MPVMLQIQMPPDYPSSAPPVYQLNAPWLRGDNRADLEASLQEIYVENMGESIIYLWVEEIREFLKSGSWRSQDCSGEADVTELELELDDLEVCGRDTDRWRREGLAGSHGGEDAGQDQLYTCPEIKHGEPLSDRKSKFMAHLAPVIHVSQVKIVLDKLKEDRKIAAATHNIFAYRICRGDDPSRFHMGCEDDGETKAGSRLLHLLQTVDARDVIVVVTRWYGGIHLGPDRFKHISGLARQILGDCGYIKEKTTKKGTKSSKKR
ncbi:protein IMPACT-like isoform X2 [Liolophura sinensis]